VPSIISAGVYGPGRIYCSPRHGPGRAVRRHRAHRWPNVAPLASSSRHEDPPMTRTLANLTAFNLVGAAVGVHCRLAVIRLRQPGQTRGDSTYLLHVFLGLLSGTTALGVPLSDFHLLPGHGPGGVKEGGDRLQDPRRPIAEADADAEAQDVPGRRCFAMLIAIATTSAGAGPWATKGVAVAGPTRRWRC